MNNYNTLNLHGITDISEREGNTKDGTKYTVYTFTDTDNNDMEVTAFWEKEDSEQATS